MAICFSRTLQNPVVIREEACTATAWKNCEKRRQTDPHLTDRISSRDRCFAALCYLGPLCIAVYLFSRKSRFVRRHAAEGMFLLLIGCAYLFFTGIFELLLGRMLWQLGFAASMLFAVGGLLFPLLSVIGISASLQGKHCRLPIIGKISVIRPWRIGERSWKCRESS